MKHVLLIFTLLCASYMAVNAQNNTWTGNADNNWGNVANWSLNAVPNAANDVVIPTGKTVNLNVTGTTKSIVVQGNSIFNMSNTLSILNASSVAANATCVWTNGSLTGGGTLTNNGTFNLSSGSTKSVVGVTTFNNTGNFNILDGGDFNITDGVFNNLASGVVDMRGNEGNISYAGGASRILNNSGLIKRTTNTGTARIQVVLNNNGGTITVSSGNLIFDTLDKNLAGGIYNVSTGSVLQWSTTVNVSGTLTGAINGEIAWTGNVSVAGTSTFDFSGSSGVSWSSGNLTGGGTLANKNLIFLSSGSDKSIIGLTTLDNEGDFNILDSGDFNITDGVFNNQSSGVIDMRGNEGNISYSGGASRILNNSGLIKSTATGGTTRIQTVLNNNAGTISVSSGNLIFDFLDKNLNGGTYNVSTGSIMQWNSNTVVSGTLTGALNGEIAWTNTVTVPTSTIGTFNFTGSSGVSWSAGNLTGGGALVNKNLIFLSSGNTKSIIGLTTLNNEGDFNILDSGDFNITDGVFNNLSSGVIDMRGNEGNISYSGDASRILNNSGLIKVTTITGNARIQSVLNNNGGTIAVSSGNLIFDFLDKNLNGGTYNVSDGSIMQWNSNTIVSGTLTGNLTGEIAWTNNVTVPTSTAGIFNFTGNSGIRWSAGNLTGGGTLVNQSLIFLSTGSIKSIVGVTTLNNEGDFNITDSGDLNITDGIFNNQSMGTIDLQGNEGNISYSGGASRILNNFGLLKGTTSGNARIKTILNNSGSIDAQSGTIVFSEFLPFINEEEGIVKGVATVTIANTANYSNNGTFAPGGSPGTLTFNGIFKSSPTSGLDVELNGLTSGTQYDVLAITGTNAIFEGNVNVDLGFDANVGDSFTIATVSGVIATKNLVSPVYADFGCKHYTFNISYPNDKSVLLTISAKEDIVPPEVITQDITVQLDNSGNASITTDQIDNGSTDNCTGHEELVFTLDITDFSCANLGENTVTLTVKDEAVNSASATATVTVVDSINPTVNCGVDSTIDSNGNYTLPNYIANSTASASDNCSATLIQTPAAGTSLADGTYTISFIATDGSGNIANCSFSLTVVDSSLGVNDFELSEASIQLYPNPVINTLTIKNTKQLELLNAQIMDITGKTISTFNIKDMGLTKEISLGNYASGMYFIKIKGLNSSITRRVIKQ